ncbi:hypothetical protein DFH07DRAFT_791530 [Mycena maculata]|uniref:DUF159-domain-containing protein n=1 Tax=Mycena maculata TaxID=230809 RepID=A0AAD7KCD5_9AGAR|nr:hypothetical protein DFH07DRAFT_791530 [Mycena maculata]
MCGRFALRLDAAEIQQLDGYDVSVNEWERREAFVPRYNIAPHSQAPVIRRRDPKDPQSIISTMTWGLVPHYSKFEDKTLNTTNARSENLVEGGGMWASIKGPNRCAVVCQGYYEWLTKGKNKLPHFVKPKDGRLMLMAGLYDSVVLQGETETLWTFTIVTTAANSQLSWLHHRQPVILSTSEALSTWLDTSSQKWNDDLAKLVAPTSFPLECYQVPKEVGKVGTESPTFIVPVANRKDGIQAMFSKQKDKQASPKKAAPSPGAKRSLPPADTEDDKVEIVDGPPPSKKSKPTPNKTKSTPKKKNVNSESPDLQPSSSKITSFFSKP